MPIRSHRVVVLDKAEFARQNYVCKKTKRLVSAKFGCNAQSDAINIEIFCFTSLNAHLMTIGLVMLTQTRTTSVARVQTKAARCFGPRDGDFPRILCRDHTRRVAQRSGRNSKMRRIGKSARVFKCRGHSAARMRGARAGERAAGRVIFAAAVAAATVSVRAG